MPTSFLLKLGGVGECYYKNKISPKQKQISYFACNMMDSEIKQRVKDEHFSAIMWNMRNNIYFVVFSDDFVKELIDIICANFETCRIEEHVKINDDANLLKKCNILSGRKVSIECDYGTLFPEKIHPIFILEPSCFTINEDERNKVYFCIKFSTSISNFEILRSLLNFNSCVVEMVRLINETSATFRSNERDCNYIDRNKYDYIESTNVNIVEFHRHVKRKITSLPRCPICNCQYFEWSVGDCFMV